MFGNRFWLLHTTITLMLLSSAPRASALQREESNTKSSRDTDTTTQKGPNEVVVVSAARTAQDAGETTALVTTVAETTMRTAPVLALDQILRQVPGFSLFRRSSSLSAHPTTQGVSLRGIGPSGTSRTLVLLDGIPLNDPFGGWIYWNRIPTSALDRVEVVRGASSQLYGSSALGGIIQLISRQPKGKDVRLSGSVGSLSTYDLEASAADRKGPWSYLVAGRLLDTSGFYAVDEKLRGAVDQPVSVEFKSFFGRVRYGQFWAGLNLYQENRGNGTRLQTNNSHLVQFDAGIDQSTWNLGFYTQTGVLESQFSRILPDRSLEIRTAHQRFPSSGAGVSATKSLYSNLIIGTDWRYVRWEEHSQDLLGLFAQYLWPVHERLDIQLGSRLDLWSNSATQFTLNPRTGLLFRAAHQFTLRGSLYRGFRAPTLNELYRPFRVGNVITEANPHLHSEDLWGGEGGVDFHPVSRLLVRFTAFWNRLSNPVGNATVSVSPTLIRRERRNLGKVDVRGLELDGKLSVSDRWSVECSYLHTDSEVAATGYQLPQVPRHQLSAGLRYDGTTSLVVQGRWAADQFEDDLNQMILGSFGLIDVGAEKALGENLGLFLKVSNLFDKRFAVALTPTEKLGEPRVVYGGLRLALH